jgi:hypothetical protein
MKCCVVRMAFCLTLLDAGIGLNAADDIALPPIKVAGSDERGRITVNDKPFFPILMYDVPVDAESLKMFRDHGFNMLSTRVEDAELARKHGFYVAAHAGTTDGQNLDGVLFGVGMDSPALYWKEDLLEKSKADLAKLQAMFPQRPIFHAIGYWENEPDGVYTNKVPPKDRYEELVKVIDVAAPYLYPLPYQPVKSVGEAVERANAAGGGKKPILPVLQLFVWKPEDPYPTAAELKCMAYLALIHGGDGIAYYSYNYVAGKTGTNIAKEQPELWDSIKPLNRHVKLIGEFLLDSQPDPTVKVTAKSADIAWRAAIRNRYATLLLIANPTDKDQAVTVEVPSRFRALRRFVGGEVLVRKGAANFTLKPYEALGLRGVK